MYKKQSKQFAKIIKTYPLTDSLGNAAFIGTTNFNLRKPNFVIIHHTAQNSCEQTLQTFTRQGSQVSAHYVICKDGTTTTCVPGTQVVAMGQRCRHQQQQHWY